jgi:hypothetical protein
MATPGAVFAAPNSAFHLRKVQTWRQMESYVENQNLSLYYSPFFKVLAAGKKIEK